MMKWPFLSLLVLGTIFGDDLQQASCQSTSITKKKTPEAAWDADLYHRDDQVVSAHLEFLYWKTLETDLIYAQKMSLPAWGPANNAVQGNYENSSFNIDPGFRVGVSFFRAPKFWEVYGSYTRLTSRGTNSIEAPNSSTQFLTAAWPVPLMSQLTSATSSLHLNYNVADFYVDRYFNPNPHLRLRLLGGLTGTWLDQNWTVKYTDTSSNTSRVQNSWSYWGCGLRFGVMADWFWTSNIYLTTKATVGGFMGPYHNRAYQTTTVLSSGYNSTLPIRDANYRDTRPAGNAQLIIGPSWQQNWTDMRTELFVGYEFNAWMNLQEVYHSTLGAPSDPKETWINTGWLGLQGLTARFTIDF